VWVYQKTGVPVARGVTVILGERISDGLSVLALSSLGVIAYPQYWPGFAAVLAALLAGVVISQIRPLALALLALASRLPLIGRFADQLHEFYEGAYSLFRPRATLTAVGLGTMAWLGEGISMYLVLLGLGVAPGWQTFSLAVFTLSFSIVIGAVSALPGGLAATEGSITGMLTLLLNLPPSSAAAATLLIRFATLWFGVSLGLITWSFSPDLFADRADPQAGDQPA
jgi:glycosyltransferase 2 family protein